MKKVLLSLCVAMLGGCGNDVQTEISKCNLQWHFDSQLRTCMSANGYDFKWEEDTCTNPNFNTANWTSCYERRGALRDVKRFFKN